MVNSTVTVIQHCAQLKFVFDFQKYYPCDYRKQEALKRLFVEAHWFSDQDMHRIKGPELVICFCKSKNNSSYNPIVMVIITEESQMQQQFMLPRPRFQQVLCHNPPQVTVCMQRVTSIPFPVARSLALCSSPRVQPNKSPSLCVCPLGPIHYWHQFSISHGPVRDRNHPVTKQGKFNIKNCS